MEKKLNTIEEHYSDNGLPHTFYVDADTAVILARIGFNEKVRNCYFYTKPNAAMGVKGGWNRIFEHYACLSNEDWGHNLKGLREAKKLELTQRPIAAPTFYEVNEWLYNVCGIYCSVDLVDNNFTAKLNNNGKTVYYDIYYHTSHEAWNAIIQAAAVSVLYKMRSDHKKALELRMDKVLEDWEKENAEWKKKIDTLTERQLNPKEEDLLKESGYGKDLR